MAAATITREIETSDPSREVVVLTLTDGETYVSKKFSTILAALVSSNYDADAHINVTYSSQTATVNWAGQTDQVCTLVLFGTN